MGLQCCKYLLDFHQLLAISGANRKRRQMRGRAGRKGKDEVGETYLCCTNKDWEDVVGLLEAELPAIASGLAPGRAGIKR